jgi:uncharacterized protein YbjT (DUF2867 family)
MANPLILVTGATGTVGAEVVNQLVADFMAGAKLAQVHIESEQRLRASGMAWTVLRPGWFASNVLMWRVMEQGGLFLPAGDGRDVPIDPRDIAAVGVKALTMPGHEGKTYEITGPEFLTYAEMIRKVAIATGKSVAYVDTPEATVREGMLAAGINPEMVNSFTQYFSGVKAGKIYPPTTGWWTKSWADHQGPSMNGCGITKRHSLQFRDQPILSRLSTEAGLVRNASGCQGDR